MQQLLDRIRDIPDFPKPGIVFKDISPLLGDPAALGMAVELMANPFRGKSVDVVIGAESRGFIFGIAVAQTLAAGFVPVRKPGKLPAQTRSVAYELEYGKNRLEMHVDALRKGQRVVIVDDLIATGGTMGACVELIRQSGAELLGASVLIELEALGGREKTKLGGQLRSVLRF